ncbi:hypothetical protein EHS25_010201 [Saitozyma podzolica]|uniref:DUF7598 domain-containing protein n=1 Tax=Saitozyma podzolica TaxID=1890683 RepID=A0A427YIV5_9TREE|nr:hypothetical protein EHS25_010201 [Saitozyma podzolica]
MGNDALKPFLPARPSGPIFIGLNVLRLLSIIALLLVFAANVVTMADDIKAIKASNASSSQSSTSQSNSTTAEDWDCDYYEYSSVPDQTGGPFWSILNRLFIVFECILLILSEVGIPRKFFENFMPVLGPAHGLGCLGVFQCLIGAQVLSHYCDLFPQVSSWLLFIIGGLNIVAGVVLRAKAKERQLIFSWENVSSLTPQTRMAATAWDMVTEKRQASQASHSHSASQGMTEVPLERSATQASDSPLLPSGVGQTMSERFAGFGFGRQGEKKAAERGWKISRPMESLPRYAV